ncbi:phage tail sheath subtilisin-like domain-containing protein [Nocardia sp. XZ_19_385]|uniref:phage tail sheath family protein n=1 Tax=Nocardia sp. XZ_19_385 TaxID=2769488 RepID=UPI001890A683|nr:phage tail sheath subtilisin-like domain-containing protein [Nocardia sp. XZ_19_385]
MIDVTKTPPGVYIDEITPTGPIAGTGTSTAAFIGTVSKANAVLNTPAAVTNWTTFVEQFGDYDKTKTLPFAVRGFFENGGTLAYVVAYKDTGDLDTALAALRPLQDISLVCLPGVVDGSLQRKVITECETLADRVAILDGAADPTPLKADGALQTQRGLLESKSGFAALYWPWIKVIDPKKPGELLAIPPSGHIAGIIARSDTERGVHKAPANEVIRGAVALDFLLDNTTHGVLNNLNINGLRTFPGRPPMVWGARTTAPKDNTAWRNLNVRRLMSFIEDSIVAGTNWAVFEPNNIALWKRLELSITEFLTRVWQSGALFGATAAEAFYVKIDQELNPPDIQAQGQLFGEIGVAPVHPAEYVIFRVGMWDGGAQITEG